MDERIYVIGIDMDNKEPKDIAQEAMEKIAGTYMADYHPETGTFIDNKYKKNGNWIITKRKNTIYYDKNDKEMELTDVVFRRLKVKRKEEVVVEVSEGDTSDYWLATAANAIKPLYQLIALAKMRQDCIWSGD